MADGKLWGIPWWVLVVAGVVLLKSGILSSVTGSSSGLVGGASIQNPAQTMG